MQHLIQKLALIFALAFAFNYTWEHLHAVLYTQYKGGSITDAVLFHATLLDATFISLITLPFLMVEGWRRRAHLIIPIGLFLGAVIELWALNTGRWAYASTMPLVPFLHVGLSPLLQLGVLGYVSYTITTAVLSQGRHP
jgi:hypothetical protein